MNITLTLSRTNLPKIEQEIIMAKADRQPFVRINASMSELTKTDVCDWEVVTLFNNLLLKYKMKAIVVLYTQVNNSKYWRKFLAVPGSPEDNALWKQWSIDDANSLPQDWKNPNGLRADLWTPVIDWFYQFKQLMTASVVYEIDNEPGNTSDARRFTWGTAPIGFVPDNFCNFAYKLCKKLTGVTLVSPGIETQEHTSAVEQWIGVLDGYIIMVAGIGINWYLTKWLSTDTPETFAARFWADIKAFKTSYITVKQPLYITEWYPLGAPVELLSAIQAAVRSAKPTTIKSCNFYPM